MKDKISFLFRRNETVKTSPIMLILLGVVILSALTYFLYPAIKGGNEKDTNETVINQEAEMDVKKGFIDMLKNKFTLKKKPEIINDVNITSDIPVIPEGIYDFNFSSTDQPDSSELFDNKLEQPNLKDVGRRDPMKKIVGEFNGKAEGGVSNQNTDLLDESKGYFEGVSINDIILDNITHNKYGDNKTRGTFIVNGSIIPDLEKGDYLLDTYYISGFNTKNETVTLEYSGTKVVKSPKKIIDNTLHIINEEGKPSSK